MPEEDMAVQILGLKINPVLLHPILQVPLKISILFHPHPVPIAGDVLGLMVVCRESLWSPAFASNSPFICISSEQPTFSQVMSHSSRVSVSAFARTFIKSLRISHTEKILFACSCNHV